jgi:hypothetical protein
VVHQLLRRYHIGALAQLLLWDYGLLLPAAPSVNPILHGQSGGQDLFSLAPSHPAKWAAREAQTPFLGSPGYRVEPRPSAVAVAENEAFAFPSIAWLGIARQVS